MADEPKKVLAKIRTFAQDVEQQKGKGVPVSTQSEANVPNPVTEPEVVTDKLKAPEVFKNPTPLNTAPPAFHELHKKPAHHTDTEITHAPASFAKAPALGKATFTEEDVEPKSVKRNPTSYTEATIITDTKKNKVDVVASSATSLSAWWKQLLNGFKRKQPPKYTVADVERRKGVIQKATSKTGTIFTADNETLREEIRRRQLSTPVSANDTDTPELLWSPNTEVGYPLLPSTTSALPHIENVAVVFKKRSVPPPVIVEPSIAPIITAQPKTPEAPIEVLPLKNEAPIPKRETMWESELPIVNVEAPQPVVATPWVSAPPPTVSVPVVPPAVFAEKPPTPEPKQTTPAPTPTAPKLVFHFGNFDRVNTNRLSLSIVGILGAALVAVFLAQIVMRLIIPLATPAVQNEPAVALLSGSQIVDLPVSSLSETSIEAALTLVPETSSSVSEIRLLDQTTGTVLETQAILRSFNFDVNPNFNQSVTLVRLLLVNNERALLLKVSDPTTVFGGLLAWEPNIATDLASLLKIQAAPLGERFTDGTIGQSDIRILTRDGTETLVYGFIDKNTVLIAGNQSVFTTLLNSQ